MKHLRRRTYRWHRRRGKRRVRAAIDPLAVPEFGEMRALPKLREPVLDLLRLIIQQLMQTMGIGSLKVPPVMSGAGKQRILLDQDRWKKGGERGPRFFIPAGIGSLIHAERRGATQEGAPGFLEFHPRWVLDVSRLPPWYGQRQTRSGVTAPA